ncbi:MAG TPA: response regulator transcription factor [Gemmatimonadetes bacterium]|nr:response regulator transcription factor [Gemmatimonadota bacterium]
MPVAPALPLQGMEFVTARSDAPRPEAAWGREFSRSPKLSGRAHIVGAYPFRLRAELKHVASDVLLLDIRMPGPGSMEILRRLRREHPEIPILTLSNSPEADYAIRAFKGGVLGYLRKDADHLTLIEAVRRFDPVGLQIQRKARVIIEESDRLFGRLLRYAPLCGTRARGAYQHRSSQHDCSTVPCPHVFLPFSPPSDSR